MPPDQGPWGGAWRLVSGWLWEVAGSEMAAKDSDLWVFAYGSLMWRPGFAYAEAHNACLVGHHRAFCIYSIHYRGTHEHPGLVLGLDKGGACQGIAYRVPAAAAQATLHYLRAREQVTGVYYEARVPVMLAGHSGHEVQAVSYLVERRHPGYAGHLPLHLQARIIRGASGHSGPNIDYLANTLLHLRELSIRERALERLAGIVGAMIVNGREAGLECCRAKAMTRAWACKRPALRRLRPDQRRRFVHRLSIGAWRD